MKIAIFGLGRIGLPIALTCADSGYEVTGIDISKTLISKLKKGKVPFFEPGMEELLKKYINKRFFPINQDNDIASKIKDAEYIMIAVGTGFAKYPDEPKLSTLYSIIGQLINIGIKEKTLILRVTLPIGTSENIKSLIEEKTSLIEGKDFWFAFVPERIIEGKAIEEEHSLPKIVGSFNKEGGKKAKIFFKKIGGDIIQVNNPRTAEFIKLIDNSWRNTRFAFANELTFLAREKDIDIEEAINAANKGYERNGIPRPGPVSGYCLGKDPYILELAFENIAKERGFSSVWYYGRRANDWLNKKILEDIKGKSVLIAGLSFKENIDDFRYSHGIDIVRKLIDENYEIYVFDPYINKNYYTKLPNELSNRLTVVKSMKTFDFKEVDTIMFLTRHKEFYDLNINELLEGINKNIKIIDLWNIFSGVNKFEKNIEYIGFGRKKIDQ